MNTTLIMHDTLDPTLPNNKDMWANIRSAYRIHHVFKIDGVQERGFVQYGPEHSIPDKKVCVLTPYEATAASIPATELSEYAHPLVCAYVFGPDNAIKGWHKKFEGPDTDYITIKTPGRAELYSFQAAAMVLWHRHYGRN